MFVDKLCVISVHFTVLDHNSIIDLDQFIITWLQYNNILIMVAISLFLGALQ